MRTLGYWPRWWWLCSGDDDETEWKEPCLFVWGPMSGRRRTSSRKLPHTLRWSSSCNIIIITMITLIMVLQKKRFYNIFAMLWWCNSSAKRFCFYSVKIWKCYQRFCAKGASNDYDYENYIAEKKRKDPKASLCSAKSSMLGTIESNSRENTLAGWVLSCGWLGFRYAVTFDDDDDIVEDENNP